MQSSGQKVVFFVVCTHPRLFVTIFGELWLLYVVDWAGRGGARVSVDETAVIDSLNLFFLFSFFPYFFLRFCLYAQLILPTQFLVP